MEWNELTEDHRYYWISRGWNEQQWQDQNYNSFEETPDNITNSEFKPMVISFPIPQCTPY